MPVGDWSENAGDEEFGAGLDIFLVAGRAEVAPLLSAIASGDGWLSGLKFSFFPRKVTKMNSLHAGRRVEPGRELRVIRKSLDRTTEVQPESS